MTQMTVAERRRRKNLMSEEAVRLYLQSNWYEAEQKNLEIIKVTLPEDVSGLIEAHNRLGKARMELGRFREAHEAYTLSLQLDPQNVIALKQVKRLYLLVEQGVDGEASVISRKVDPKLLVEEMGKSKIFPLPVAKIAPAVLARLQPGDELFIKEDGQLIRVEDVRGEAIGDIPPRAASRLVNLTRGGNRYVVGVVSVSERDVKILVREIYQDASQLGTVSFPSKAMAQPSINAHLRAGIERRDIDEDELQMDTDGDDDGDTDDEDAEGRSDEYGSMDGGRDGDDDPREE